MVNLKIEICGSCSGFGVKNEEVCIRCNGTGRIVIKTYRLVAAFDEIEELLEIYQSLKIDEMMKKLHRRLITEKKYYEVLNGKK